ncbi:MAG: C2 domain-containing protein [Acidobacteriota bacterium]
MLYFNEVLDLEPRHAAAFAGRAASHYARAVVREESGRLEESLTDLYKAYEDGLRAPTPLPFLGDLHLRIARQEAATGAYEKARHHAGEALLRLDRRILLAESRRLRGLASYELAREAAEQDAYSEAFDYLDEALADHPPLALKIYLRQGEIHARKFDFNKAFEATRRAYRVSNDDLINLQAGYDLARYSAIMNRTEDALEYLYEFYESPSLYQDARELANAATSDFYTIFSDHRFQAWLEGKKRIRLDITSAHISFCEDGIGLCDPYVQLWFGSDLIWRTNHLDNTHQPIWNDYVVTDFAVHTAGDVARGTGHLLQLWDADVSEDDLVGTLALPRLQLITDAAYRGEIRSNEQQIIGYLNYRVTSTGAEVDMSIVRLSPSLSVIAWPILSCLAEFGVDKLVDLAVLRKTLLELRKLMKGRSFRVEDTLGRFAQDFLPELLLGSKVDIVVDALQFAACLGKIEY